MSKNPFLISRTGKLEQKRYLNMMIMATMVIGLMGFVLITILFFSFSKEAPANTPVIGEPEVSRPISFPESFPVTNKVNAT